MFLFFYQRLLESPAPVPKESNVFTSPTFCRSYYTSLSNTLVLTNFLKHPAIWYPIPMSNTSLFVFCNTVLDIKYVQPFMNVFTVDHKNFIACILLRCFLPEPKFQNHTITPGQSLPYKIWFHNFYTYEEKLGF